MSLKDERNFKGKTLWIAAGNQMVYYPYTAGHIDFKPGGDGLLKSPDALLIKDAVEQPAKPDRLNRVPLGDKQVFMLFTFPSDPAKEYAVPVGSKTGSDYTFSSDDIFYYDDPHTLFSHWSPAMWKSIDQHQVIPGMSERQAYVALGQVAAEHGTKIGDEMVTFDNYGHPVNVTFEHNKATKIEPVTP